MKILKALIVVTVTSSVLGSSLLTCWAASTGDASAIGGHAPLAGTVSKAVSRDPAKKDSSKIGLSSQIPHPDQATPAPPSGYGLKAQAVWDVFSQTCQRIKAGRFFEIDQAFSVLSNPKLDDGDKQFASSLIKRWRILSERPTDPPPIDMKEFRAVVWSLGSENFWGATHKPDADNDGKYSKQELQALLPVISGDKQYSLEGTDVSGSKFKAILEVIIENYDYISRLSNGPEYKYL